MISYKGKLPIGVVIPVMAQLVAAFDLSALAGEIVALTSLVLTVTPPSVVGIFAVIAAIGAAIQAGFVPPAIDFKADLKVKLGLLQAKYDLLLKVSNLVAGGSVRLYEYQGPSSSFGPDLGAALAGPDAGGGVTPTQSTFAIVLLAEGGTSGEVTLKALRGET